MTCKQKFTLTLSLASSIVNQGEADSDIQAFTSSTVSQLEGGSDTQHPASSTVNTRWGTVKENTNLNQGRVSQGRIDLHGIGRQCMDMEVVLSRLLVKGSEYVNFTKVVVVVVGGEEKDLRACREVRASRKGQIILTTVDAPNQNNFNSNHPSSDKGHKAKVEDGKGNKTWKESKTLLNGDSSGSISAKGSNNNFPIMIDSSIIKDFGKGQSCCVTVPTKSKKYKNMGRANRTLVKDLKEAFSSKFSTSAMEATSNQLEISATLPAEKGCRTP
ncbi:conserved hypothetical protein [Ricinus communis]|uniref:Uncharacterized protein n=1 Tax=Ricinus communis TaxID=3988 RepID=B9S7F7_RICCO|nr:conserved hypothetical protein [Ricinus communis]